MRYHLVFAHPEPASFNGYLRDRAVKALEEAGHEVLQSDLYAMEFKAVADGEDFAEPVEGRLVYHEASGEAFARDALSPDILAEHKKLRAADVVVFQFPLWWFGPPAILKGWIDRVFCSGFAIGIAREDGKGWRRYGEGPLCGKSAMLAVTTGAQAAHMGARGVHGPVADLLFPLNHGVLHYAGASVVEPFLVHGAARIGSGDAAAAARDYARRLLDIAEAPLIPYRHENAGDYDRGILVNDSVPGGGFASHLVASAGSAGEEAG